MRSENLKNTEKEKRSKYIYYMADDRNEFLYPTKKVYSPTPAVADQETIKKRIEILAYLMWERHGCPHNGDPKYFWSLAEAEFYRNFHKN